MISSIVSLVSATARYLHDLLPHQQLHHNHNSRKRKRDDGHDSNGDDDKDLHLLQAAKDGDYSLVQTLLLKAGSHNVNVQNDNGETPLLVACKEGRWEVAEWLIKEHDADVTISDKYGWTPLHEACRDNNLSNNPDHHKLVVVNLLILIDAGSDYLELINAREIHARTPLHLACICGDWETSKLLIQYGADIDAKVNIDAKAKAIMAWHEHEAWGLDVNKNEIIKANHDGNTPLHYACAKGHLEIAKLLIDNGANVTVENSAGEIPIHLACWCGSVEITELLLMIENNYLAQIDAQDINGCTPLHTASANCHLEVVDLLVNNYGADVHATDNSGKTPLHHPCASNDLEIVQVLIESGADPNVQDNDGNSPFRQVDEDEVFRYLVENGGCDVNDIDVKDGRTLLHGTCECPPHGLLEDAKLLVSYYGANMNVQDNNGDTPLHLACWHGYTKCAIFLVENGAALNIRNNYGVTPMHLACGSLVNFDISRLLVENGADIDIRDNLGEKPLHVACDRGRFDASKLLVENGADIHAQDDHGMTALYLACRQGNLHIVKLLLSRGANPNETTTTGDTPLQVASKYNHLEIVWLLLSQFPLLV